MTRTTVQRVADVRSLLDAAREVAASPGGTFRGPPSARMAGALASELVRSTGLSREGVELALARHLETDATDDELAALVAYATRTGGVARVTVVLSANVFVGALRALAIARAAAPEVVVRPSRREPVFAKALVAAARDPALRIEADLDVAAVTTGEIHVYGRDETIADVRARARVPVRGHGSGMGIAFVSAGADVEAAAAALVDDVVAFDQRGCLSPRVALVEGNASRAALFADALHVELERAASRVPRGELPPEERAASQRYVSTMAFASPAHVRVGTAHVVGIGPEGSALVVPPTHRHVHVVACASRAEAIARIEPLARWVVTVGADTREVACAISPQHARSALFGRMQRPPLDGPVDFRGA